MSNREHSPSLDSSADEDWNGVPAAWPANFGQDLDYADAPLRRALATAKGTLTRRTNAFLGLVQRIQECTHQELVDSRARMVAACDELIANLEDYAQRGLDLDQEIYLDGQRRVAECRGPHQELYEENLAIFVEQVSLHASQHSGLAAVPSRTMTSVQPSEVPSNISAVHAAALREQLEQENLVGIREIERQHRAEERALRLQELEDQREAAEDALALRNQNARNQLEIAIAAAGRSSRGSRAGRGSIAGTLPSRQSAGSTHHSRGSRASTLRSRRSLGTLSGSALQRLFQPLPLLGQVVEEAGLEDEPPVEVFPAAPIPAPRQQSPVLPGAVPPVRDQAQERAPVAPQRQLPRLDLPRQPRPARPVRRRLPAVNTPAIQPPAVQQRHVPPVHRRLPAVNPPAVQPPAAPPIHHYRPPVAIPIPPSLERSPLPRGDPVASDIVPSDLSRSDPELLREIRHNSELQKRIQLEEQRLSLEAQRAIVEAKRAETVRKQEARQAIEKQRQAQLQTEEMERQLSIAREMVRLRNVTGQHLDPSVKQETRKHDKETKPHIHHNQAPKYISPTKGDQTTILNSVSPHSHGYNALPTTVRAHTSSSSGQTPSCPHSQCCGKAQSPPSAANDYMAVVGLQLMHGQKQEPFKGDAGKYPEFLADYHQLTSGLQSNPVLCLQVLKKLVDGPAHHIIRRKLLDVKTPEVSLREALATLEQAYGAAMKQSRAQLDALLTRAKVEGTEKGLMEFYSDLDCCKHIMQECQREQDLDSSEVLEKLFAKLPEYLQNKWEKKIAAAKKKAPLTPVRATYNMLMELIHDEHEVKSGELNLWREALKTKRKPGSKSVKINAFQEGSATGNHSHGKPGQKGRTGSYPVKTHCLCGTSGTHQSLAQCPTYKSLTTRKERWALLKSGTAFRPCYNCLKTGHLCTACTESPCGINGCTRRHHHTLHAPWHEQPQGGQTSSNVPPAGSNQAAFPPLGQSSNSLPATPGLNTAAQPFQQNAPADPSQ